MAKTPSKFETDDYNFDSELDMPDFSFDAKEPKDDRKPSHKIATSFAHGAKDSVLNTNFLRNQIKHNLPRGYGQGLDLVGEATGTLKGLYNTTATEIKPLVNDLKRTTKRLMPTVSKFIPKSASDMINKWAVEDKKSNAQTSADEIRESGLNSQLGEIFKYQEEKAGQQAAEADAKGHIKEQIQQDRHRDNISQMDAMRISLGSLQQYQDRVTSQYQRKSLELQFRHYFVAMDSLEEQKKNNVVTLEHMANIAKNTALPEYEKLTKSERLGEVMRNKFISGISDTVFDKRRGLIRGFGKNFVKNVGGKVRDFSDNFRNGLQMADMGIEMQQSMAEMGMGPSGSETAGNMVGGLVGDSLGGKLGKRVGKYLKKRDGVQKLGNRASFYAENAPQLMWDFAESNKGDDLPMGIGSLVRLAKDSMGQRRADHSMEVDDLSKMQNPAIFSNQTRKTINEIIPGFLSRIYRELQIIRTGDDKIELTGYDLSKNKFDAASNIRKGIFDHLVKKHDIETNHRDLESLLNRVDPDKDKLHPDARKALGDQLLRDNLNNLTADPKRLSDEQTWNGTAGRHGYEIAELFKDHFAKDELQARRKDFANDYNKLGYGHNDIRKTTQDLINAGHHDALRHTGLLDEDGRSFDVRKLHEYYAGLGYDHAPGRDPINRGPNGKLSKRRQKIVAPRDYRQHYVEGPAHPEAPASMPPDWMKKLEVCHCEEAIAKHSSKPEAVTMVSILERIDKRLEAGVNLNLTDEEAAEGTTRHRKRKRFLDATLADGVNGAAGAASWVAGKAHSYTSKAFGHVNDVRKKAWAAAKSGYNWSREKLDDFSDVYIKGKAEAILTSARLKAGEYYDSATGKVIEKWSDVQGSVCDENGVLLSASEMKNAFGKTKIGSKLFSAVKSIKDLAVKAGGKAMGYYNNVYKLGWDLAKKSWGLLDLPTDIFIKAKTDGPIMTAAVMRAGGYRSARTGEVINKPSQIDGAVLDVDDDNNTILTKEQFAAGIFDKHGKAISHGIIKLAQLGHGLYKHAKAKVKQLAGWANKMVSGSFGKAGDWMSSVFSKITGPDGLIVAGGSKINDKLTMIYDLLDDRLSGSGNSRKHHIVADDGHGMRSGSWQEQRAKAKEAELEAGGKIKEKGKGLYGKGKDGLAAMLAKLKKKKDDKDDDKSSPSVDIDIDGHGKTPEEKAKAKRAAAKERLKRMKAGKPKTLGGKAWNLAKKGGRGLKTAATVAGEVLGVSELVGGVGAVASGIGSVAAGAGGLLSGAASLAGGAIMGTAGVIGAGAGTVGGLLAGAATGAVALLSSPVVLGALALAAVGAAGYYGYKFLTKKRLKPLNTVRYAQYGFLSADEDHLQQVLGLEDKVKDTVKFVDGVATMSMEHADVKSMAQSFGLDLKDQRAVGSWMEWFVKRFKPVYLTSMTAAYKTNPKVKLDDIDGDFSPTEKGTYLNLAKFPDGPYNFGTSPFGSKDYLKAGAREVSAAVELAQASVDKELADHPASKADTIAAAAALGKGDTTKGDLQGAEKKRLDGDHKDEAVDKTRITGANARFAAARGLTVALAAESAKLPYVRSSDGKLDALTTVRYKTYGLVAMDFPKVKALDALELAMVKGLDYGKDDVATWKGEPQAMLRDNGPNFSLNGVRNNNADSWLMWFQLRFLPTYLSFATAMKRLTKAKRPNDGLFSIEPAIALQVAQATYTATVSYGSSKISVWTVPQSPFPGYQLNVDSKSIDVNLAALKGNAKDVVMGATEGKISPETLKKPENKFLASVVDRFSGGTKGVDLQKNPSPLASTVDKTNARGTVVGRTGLIGATGTGLSMLKGGAGGFTGGTAIQQPGGGTGGDINKIPQPKGDGSWTNMKEMFAAVAAMTGVDVNLLGTMAAIESGFKMNAKAGTSTAKGLFQFLDSTWATMLKKYGGKYGIDPKTPATDPRANALMGAEYVKENMAALKNVKPNMTDTDVYIAHFMGAGGARKFLSADPNTIAAQLMPKEALANKSLYGSGSHMYTVGEMYQNFNNLVRTKGGKFGITGAGAAGSPTVGAAAPGASPTGMPTTSAGGTPAVTATPTSGTATPAGNPGPVSAGPVGIMAMSDKGNTPPAPTAATLSGPAPAPAVGATPSVVPASNSVSSTGGGTGVDPTTAASSMGFSPAARSVSAQQSANAPDPALAGISTSMQQAIGIHQAQLDVLKQILTEVQKGGTGGGQQAQNAPASQQPRQAALTPNAPISLARPA